MSTYTEASNFQKTVRYVLAHPVYRPCLKKNCAKLFLSELHQISTNFDNFWQKDGKEAKFMPDALTFHLT